jgi:5'-3' exonuclease
MEMMRAMVLSECKKIEEKPLKLTNIEFVDLCILCGCDYTIKINKIGFVTAYKLINKYYKRDFELFNYSML